MTVLSAALSVAFVMGAVAVYSRLQGRGRLAFVWSIVALVVLVWGAIAAAVLSAQ